MGCVKDDQRVRIVKCSLRSREIHAVRDQIGRFLGRILREAHGSKMEVFI